MLDLQTNAPARPRRCLLYGVQGIGKSTFASKAPKPVFIQTEDGLGDIKDCARFPLSTSLDDVFENIKKLYGDDQYQTVCLDSLDWLERLIWERVCKDKGVESIEDIGYAKGYQFAITHWREILQALGGLRDQKGMHIVLLAHHQIVKFDDPETEAYERYSPRLHKHASALVQEWCDEVLFAKYQTFTTSQDEGFGKKRVKGIGDGKRVIRTQERPAHLAKNRLNMPLEIDFPIEDAWAEYAQYFGG